jgi:hypothetical protein
MRSTIARRLVVAGITANAGHSLRGHSLRGHSLRGHSLRGHSLQP